MECTYLNGCKNGERIQRDLPRFMFAGAAILGPAMPGTFKGIAGRCQQKTPAVMMLGSDVCIKAHAMSNRLPAPLLLLFVLGLNCAAVSRGAEEGSEAGFLVSSWSELEATLLEDLRPLEGAPEFADMLELSDTCKEILRSRNELLWATMAGQPDYPLVALAGFYCIQQENSERALEAGVKVLASAAQPASPIYDPARQYLERAEWSPGDVKKALERLLNNNVDRTNVVETLPVLPVEALESWLEEVPEEVFPPAHIVWVVDRVLAEYERTGRQAGEHIWRRLRTMAAIPGAPRYVYCCYAGPRDAAFDEALRLALSGDELSDLEFTLVVYWNAEYIKQHRKEFASVVPDVRNELFERVLDR